MKRALQKSQKTAKVRLSRQLRNGCWLDIYDGPWFEGRLRRLRGPAAKCDGRGARSAIVGPCAVVIHADGSVCKTLQPGKIIPDLVNSPLKGKLSHFSLAVAGESTNRRSKSP